MPNMRGRFGNKSQLSMRSLLYKLFAIATERVPQNAEYTDSPQTGFCVQRESLTAEDLKQPPESTPHYGESMPQIAQLEISVAEHCT